MSGSFIIGLMTFANFILLLKLTMVLVKDNRRQSETVIENGNFKSTISYLVETPKEEEKTPVPIPTPVFQSASINPKMDQMQVAINRLKLGDSPEQIAQELGYSKSEIGLLAASSRQR
jgi:hypothetical protein